jgi:hypothetical protein
LAEEISYRFEEFLGGFGVEPVADVGDGVELGLREELLDEAVIGGLEVI